MGKLLPPRWRITCRRGDIVEEYHSWFILKRTAEYYGKNRFAATHGLPPDEVEVEDIDDKTEWQ